MGTGFRRGGLVVEGGDEEDKEEGELTAAISGSRMLSLEESAVSGERRGV